MSGEVHIIERERNEVIVITEILEQIDAVLYADPDTNELRLRVLGNSYNVQRL